MKKNFYLALMGAIALTGAVGLTACTSEDDAVEAKVNPGYNPETGEVPVNFVFNVSTESRGTTRMSPATVQVSDGSFRGIQNAILLSYKLASDGSYVTNPSAAFEYSYDLNALASANYLKPETNGTESSHRILEMSLPVNTNTLMFWGRALKDQTKNAEQGNIIFNPLSNLTTNIENLSFKTNDCLSADEKAALAEYEELIATVLNKIVQATVTSTYAERDIAWSDYVEFKDDGTLELKEYDPATYDSSLDPLTANAKMSPLSRILGNLFITWNTYKTVGTQEELRNGEGAILALLMKDLFAVLNTVTSAEPTTTEERAAIEVANRVKAVINSFFDMTGTEPKWQAFATVKQNAEKTGLTRVTADLQGFPHKIFHLPPGSTILKYLSVDPNNTSTKVNQYAFMSTVPTYAMGAGDSFDPNNYIYPAELCYFGNSPIRVTNQERSENDYPNGTSYWDNDDEWKKDVHGNTADWAKNSHVLSSTRSVAMQHNINYGTSMLETKVSLKTGTTKFFDNNGGLHSGENPKEFSDTEIKNGIQLTGVLIGGQVNEVGWNYIAKGSPQFNYMVYDSELPSGTIPTTDKPNYTLVWDNWNAANKDGDQNKVYVALQFQNNTGKDFWGMHNIIRNKSSFYLIGELDPDKMPASFTIPAGEENAGATITNESAENRELYKSKKSWGIAWPEKYALPPYGNDGNTIKQRRVFIQDYMTEASFVIGPNSLKYALVSVPDLRSSQQSLGLSVDLQWRHGLQFEDVIVGGE